MLLDEAKHGNSRNSSAENDAIEPILKPESPSEPCPEKTENP